MEEERAAPQPRGTTRQEPLHAPRFMIGGVVGKGFSIWGRSFPTLIVLMAITYAPLILYQAVRIAGGSEISPPGGLAAATQPAFWIERLLGVISTAAVIYAVFQRLRGESGGIGESLRIGLSRFLPIVGATILYFLLAFGPYVPGYLVFSVQPPVGFVLLVLGVIASIYVSLVFWVAIPAVVVEHLGPVAALRRSAALTRGAKGEIFVINLIVGVVVFAAGLAVAFIAKSTKGLVIGQLIIVLVTGALPATVTAVGYRDLRRAREGVSVEELLKVFA